jgi:hypothetical protein
MANEKRLIDANETERVMSLRYKELAEEYGHYDHYTTGYSDALCVVEDAPTVDAVEVVRGRWEEYSRMPGYLQCSKCHDAHIWFAWLKDGKWNYCPNCGAKMDGGQENGS